MLKKCFFPNCSVEVSTSCNCKESLTYCCNGHLANHCLTSGSHVIVSLPLQDSEFLNKTQKIFQYLERTKKNIAIQTEKILKCVLEASKKALESIRETEKHLEEFFICALTENKINEEEYEKFPNLLTPKKETCFENYSQIAEELAKFYQINNFVEKTLDQSECDEIVFSQNNEVGGLWSIDLETFRLCELNYAKIGFGGGACILRKGVYFFYGGFKSNYVGEAYLVNLIEKTAKALKSSTPRGAFASVFKNGKIYVFGGRTSKVSFTNSSKTYEITLDKWTDIHSLPSSCGATSASVMNNEILITGFHFDKVYEYNDSSYFSVLDVHGDEYKLMCDGWIVTPSILFENEKNNNSTWKTHVISTKLEYLCVHTTFKRGRYIYFLDRRVELWRIDTVSKVTERVNYFR